MSDPSFRIAGPNTCFSCATRVSRTRYSDLLCAESRPRALPLRPKSSRLRQRQRHAGVDRHTPGQPGVQLRITDTTTLSGNRSVFERELVLLVAAQASFECEALVGTAVSNLQRSFERGAGRATDPGTGGPSRAQGRALRAKEESREMTTETPPNGRAGLLDKRRALVRGGSSRRPVCGMVSAPHGLVPRHRDACRVGAGRSFDQSGGE